MPSDTAPASLAPAPPHTDEALLSALRSDLESAPYTTDAVGELLGELASEALSRENPIPARRVLAGDDGPTATLLSLFTLGAVLPREQVSRALPSLGIDGAIDLGLLAAVDADATTMRACLDLSTYTASDDAGEVRWWIASDLSELATGQPLVPDHVLGVGGASLTLARITPREAVGRVLDVGCGGGIQAMHASRHAREVVATDLSERALAFAAFNAALNGIDLDLRQGSLLEPVAGEVFDLVVSNPPFVITPRGDGFATWTYRDGGRAGDVLTAELLAALPEHVAPGGRAVMLSNWEIAEGPDPDWQAHPQAWLAPVREAGLDAWVIQRESEDCAQYAETWARDGGVTVRDAAWDTLQEAWLDDFAARGTAAIGFGYILLHRPESARPEDAEVICEDARGRGSGTLGEHLGASLVAIDRLARLSDQELLDSRPVRAEDLVERRFLTPGEYDPMLIELVQGAGFARVQRADQLTAGVVGALEGTLTLGQIIGAVCALTDEDEPSARERLLPTMRELIRTGMVTL
ncbi:methyltransferase [Brachybacterium endophyticum]|uniref:Methyltransferase n=1 Tax=Brachybacterium endophyticum TaxID=2182385 RepID=A0A2U2RKW6_9MICO|nr:methyltransferase [Brachybacterium endophyticum]PWH06510.1 methyltransferase [Brachybacterium endophyticum]